MYEVKRMIQIAIVEDEDICAEQIKQYLDRFMAELQEPFGVIRYRDGYEIVEKYPEQVDIIFMDIEMALMDGMEAAEEIRNIMTDNAQILADLRAVACVQSHVRDKIADALHHFFKHQRRKMRFGEIFTL